jgi:hypothetical protein
MIMKNAVFWDVAACRSCFNLRFGGMYHLHLQGKNIRERGRSVTAILAHQFVPCNICLAEIYVDQNVERSNRNGVPLYLIFSKT